METFINMIAGYGTIVLQIAGIFVIILWFLRDTVDIPVISFIRKNGIAIGVLLSFAGIVMSLIYSGVIGYPPCLLCWWQRILLYPQFAILLVAWITGEYRSARITSLILSIAGICVSFVHILDQSGVFSRGLPCDLSGVSCSEISVILQGYVTIPVMAATVFAVMIIVQLVGLSKK